MRRSIQTARDAFLTAARFATYWIPEATHPLWQAGCAWLGRDPASDDPGRAPPYATAPWRYGFHATLKAPLRLASHCTEDDFVAAVAALAASRPDFTLPPLQVGWLGGFLALRPCEPQAENSPLRRLADACVRALDRFRAAPPAAGTAARATGLDAVQQALLARWGYPHVFGHWRFHLTLSDPHPAEPEALVARAEAHFADALAQPLPARAIAVFVETAPGRPLRLLQRCALGGSGVTAP